MIDNDDTETIETINDFLSTEGKSSSKPIIDHLPDAIAKDTQGRPVFLAGRGDKVVIERYATVLSHRPWLDTKTYTVEAIEEATGIVHLYDEELHRNSSTNYIDGVKNGYRFKLANAKGATIGKRKRGRPRKDPTATKTIVKPVQLGTDGQPVPKKRGRPAGSKNRSKDVIKAEKKSKLEKRKAKKTAAKASKARKVKPGRKPKA